MKKVYVLAVMAVLMLVACKSDHADLGDGLFADIKTTKGDIIVKLEYEKTPVTVANFISLAEGTNPFVSEEYKDKKYYDGIIFHRVIKDFMIQTGDPLGVGRGNPGYKFKDEFNDSLTHDKAGILSMANAGVGTNGSQFFITHAPYPSGNGRHSVFGEVVEGLEVVDSIANVKVAEGSNKPLSEVSMKTIEIIRNGKAAKNFDAVKVMTDYFADEEAKTAAFTKMKSDMAAEFLAQKEAAEELPSGLKIMTINEGTGEKPKIGQKALVSYAGYLVSGGLFDSNYEEVAKKFNVFDEGRKAGGGYESMPMDYSPEAQLIPGFREALLTMKVGDKIRVFIPSHLGYGAQGAGRGLIPPNADLVFDLEISGIVE